MKILKRLLSTNYKKENKLSKYYNYINTKEICNNNIFIECNKIETVFLNELFNSEIIKSYNIYFTSRDDSKYESDEYFEKLATSKYIITDYLFNDCFVKRDGQVAMNYWNYDNPFNEDSFNVGLIQRTFLKSDYIVFDKKENVLLNSYMINNLVSGKVIIESNYVKVFESILEGKKIKSEKVGNNKENILIYGGNLSRNGITTALKNLLNNIDLDKKNYYVVYDEELAKNYKESLSELPKKVGYLGINSNTMMSKMTHVKFLMFRANLLGLSSIKDKVVDAYKTDIKRLFGNTRIDSVIQFGGYDFRKIFLFSAFDCNRVIYVHSNMLSEIKTRSRQHLRSLKYAYQEYDKVAVITDSLIESTSKIGGRKDNIYVASNIIDYEGIIKKSKEEVKLDSYSECSVSLEELKEILNSKDKKYITIGRFSPEKSHDRLIRSFDKLYKDNKDIYLIIIGGHGELYNKTKELVNSLDSRERIILIKNVSNPYSILKKCDYFVLPSLYEGFGLVITEADILGLSVITTDIDGPRKFLTENGGTMVSNSEDGIYDGMKKLLNNEVKVMKVDYKKYNKHEIDNFYKLLEGLKNERKD